MLIHWRIKRNIFACMLLAVGPLFSAPRRCLRQKDAPWSVLYVGIIKSIHINGEALKLFRPATLT